MNNSTKMEFEVAHQLFIGMVSTPGTKDADIVNQFNKLVEKTTKTKMNIPEDTLKLFSEKKPELARKISTQPA